MHAVRGDEAGHAERHLSCVDGPPQPRVELADLLVAGESRFRRETRVLGVVRVVLAEVDLDYAPLLKEVQVGAGQSRVAGTVV